MDAGCHGHASADPWSCAADDNPPRALRQLLVVTYGPVLFLERAPVRRRGDRGPTSTGLGGAVARRVGGARRRRRPGGRYARLGCGLRRARRRRSALGREAKHLRPPERWASGEETFPAALRIALVRLRLNENGRLRDGREQRRRHREPHQDRNARTDPPKLPVARSSSTSKRVIGRCHPSRMTRMRTAPGRTWASLRQAWRVWVVAWRLPHTPTRWRAPASAASSPPG
jgi:hypothetical protein